MTHIHWVPRRCQTLRIPWRSGLLRWCSQPIDDRLLQYFWSVGGDLCCLTRAHHVAFRKTRTRSRIKTWYTCWYHSTTFEADHLDTTTTHVLRPLSLSLLGSCFSVYYESIKRDLKIKPIYECRCDERLQTKTKRFTRLSYTGLVVELEHLKIKTRLTNEKFPSVKGECEI
jgi:hypothetical protein